MNQQTRTTSLSGRRTRTFATAALLLAAVSYVPVSSAVIFDELSQDELSLIRGKFLPRGGSALQYFGLSMNTTWGTPSRANHAVGLTFGIDFSGSTPHITTSRTGTIGGAIDNNAGPDISPVLQQISGSVQNVQIGGNGNTVVNEVELAVSETGAATYDTPASAVPLVAGVSTYQSTDDVVTQFTNTQNKIGYTVQTDAGFVVQQLGGSPFLSSQLLQSIVISGNTQSILNHIKLDVRLANRNVRETALHFIGNTALFGLR